MTKTTPGTEEILEMIAGAIKAIPDKDSFIFADIGIDELTSFPDITIEELTDIAEIDFKSLTDIKLEPMQLY